MLRTVKIAVLALAAALTPAAAADRITIKVGYSPGGSYDISARLVADHLGRFLPGNPEIIVQNEPGAGSLKLAKTIMAAGATDGTEIGMIGSQLALMPVFEPDVEGFDPAAVHYLASMASEASYCITQKTSGIVTLDAFLTSGGKVGSTGKSSSTYTFPAAIKRALNGNYEMVVGFEGGSEIVLAMERGDLQARCGIGEVSIFEGGLIERVNIVAELGVEKTGRFPEADFVLDRIDDPTLRAAVALVFAPNQIHHPLVVNRGTPAELVAQLRAAFVAMSKDPEFIADAKRRGYLANVTEGSAVEARIAELLASSPEVQAKARELVE